MTTAHTQGAVARNRRRYTWDRYGPVMMGSLGIILALTIWELYSRFGPVNSHHLPPPTRVIPTFLTSLTLQEYWVAIGQTLTAWAIGLAISGFSAFFIGLVIGSSRFLRVWTNSVVEFLRPIPAVGLIPVAALLFGPRLGAELMIIVFACFWIIVIQVIYGIADVDKVARETAHTMRLGAFDMVRYLVFPTLLPYLVTGVRLAATVALILAVTVELIVGTPGLGYQVAQAQMNGSPPAMFALIITTGLLGILINFITRFVSNKLLFWHASVRGEKSS